VSPAQGIPISSVVDVVIVLLHKLGLRLLIRPWSYNVSECTSIQLGHGLINGGGLIPGGGLVFQILRYSVYSILAK
jgi:hypothetical protein